MMTAQDCADRTAACEATAANCPDTRIASDWLEAARQWQLLATDMDAQGTLARLMLHAKSLKRGPGRAIAS